MSESQKNLVWDADEPPFSLRFRDHYYSRQDGLAETRHVFLGGNGLPERWLDGTDFTIGELGFGTGLNFAAAWSAWKRYRSPGQQLHFVSVEAFPAEAEDCAKALSRWSELAEEKDALVRQWRHLGQRMMLDAQTDLTVLIGTAEEKVPSFPEVDAWFLDGFAPDRNGDMWSLDLMEIVAERTRDGGTLATYTAAGWVRRNLEQAGFAIERRQGFGTKRHMSVGYRT